jgi:hypothetical protein
MAIVCENLIVTYASALLIKCTLKTYLYVLSQGRAVSTDTVHVRIPLSCVCQCVLSYHDKTKFCLHLMSSFPQL